MSKTKRVCPTCHTTKFRKATDSGLVCKYGHKLLGIQEEAAEDDNFGGNFGRRRRKVAKIKESDKISPAKQKSDFIFIIQYALQVYSKSMIQELNFPPELEPTVRELWLLYLSDSNTEISEAYLFEAHEREASDKLKSTQEIKRDVYEKFEKEELDLDEVMMSSDSSEDEDIDDTEPVDIFKPTDRKTRQRDPITKRFIATRNKWPRISYSYTITFIYLACIYLNYPILPNDLIRWCKSNQIPFLSIQEKIPERQLGLLNFHLTNTMLNIPTADKIVMQAYKLSRCFSSNCKLKFPDFNIPLYLDRFCAQFFLPVEGYFYADRLFESCRKMSRCIANRPYQSEPATTVLLACVIAAVKLIYGVADIYNVTNDYVSEFDTKTTRGKWLNLVKENTSRWRTNDNKEDDLDYIISLIRGVGVAAKAGAYAKDKQNVIIGVMNRSLANDNLQRTTQPSFQTNTLMDTFDMLSNNNNASESTSNENNEKELIQQGRFYYKRKYGFAPHDYLSLLELAGFITGDTTGRHLESAVKKIDATIEQPAYLKKVRLAQMRERYYP